MPFSKNVFIFSDYAELYLCINYFPPLTVHPLCFLGGLLWPLIRAPRFSPPLLYPPSIVMRSRLPPPPCLPPPTSQRHEMMRGNQERCQKKSRRRGEPRKNRSQRDGWKIPKNSPIYGEEKRAFFGVESHAYLEKRGEQRGYLCHHIQSGRRGFTIDTRVTFFLGAVSRLRVRGFFEHALGLFGNEQFLFPPPTPSFGCATGERARARASRSSVPSHPVIPRLPGFSCPDIVLVQCFPTFMLPFSSCFTSQYVCTFSLPSMPFSWELHSLVKKRQKFCKKICQKLFQKIFQEMVLMENFGSRSLHQSIVIIFGHKHFKQREDV